MGGLLELLAFPGLQQVSKFLRLILAPESKKTLRDAPTPGSHGGVHVGPRITIPSYLLEIGSYLVASAAWLSGPPKWLMLEPVVHCCWRELCLASLPAPQAETYW